MADRDISHGFSLDNKTYRSIMGVSNGEIVFAGDPIPPNMKTSGFANMRVVSDEPKYEIGDEVIIKMEKPVSHGSAAEEKYKLCNGKRGVIKKLPTTPEPAFYSINRSHLYVVKLYYKPEQKFSGFTYEADGSISFRFSRGELSLLRKRVIHA